MSVQISVKKVNFTGGLGDWKFNLGYNAKYNLGLGL